ncbi:hypothetical protein V3G39_09630 [Dermatophilaceae bacterium Sec6.4]
MLRKIAAIAGATALAGMGVTLAAGPANAAPPAPTHAPGSIYMHGTAALAQFPTRSNCEAHASYEVALVAKNSSFAATLSGVQNENSVGSALRFRCYPLRTGNWSYLTAYTSKTGNPIQPQDIYLDLSNRAADVDAGTSLDTQAVYTFAHVTQHKVGTTSQATCNAQRNYIVNLIDKNTNTNRLIGADYRCTTQNGFLGYEANYLSPTRTGLAYDHVSAQAKVDQPMMDVLGYKFPGTLANNRVSPFLRVAGK